MRSMLFVPADSERKLAKAAGTAADALILDLEDSVAPERKALARGSRGRVSARRGRKLPSSGSGSTIAAAASCSRTWPRSCRRARPASCCQRSQRPRTSRSWRTTSTRSRVAHGLANGSIVMLVLVDGDAGSGIAHAPAARARSAPRLRALAWGAEDLSVALGAGDPRTADGAWRATYVHARTQCLLAAHALALAAIDTVYVDFRDGDGLARACAASRLDGFTGRLAIHPDQVAIINAAYTPSESRALAGAARRRSLRRRRRHGIDRRQDVRSAPSQGGAAPAAAGSSPRRTALEHPHQSIGRQASHVRATDRHPAAARGLQRAATGPA